MDCCLTLALFAVSRVEGSGSGSIRRWAVGIRSQGLALGGTGRVGVQLSQIVLSELRPSALAKEE